MSEIYGTITIKRERKIVNTINRWFRFIAILLIAISVIISITIEAKAQVVQGGTVLSLPFDDVENYAATNCRSSFVIFAMQRRQSDNQLFVTGRTFVDNPRFKSKAEVDAMFQSKLSEVLNQTLTNTNADFSKEFIIHAYADGLVGRAGRMEFFDFFEYLSTLEFQYSSVSGKYNIPDLSGYKMPIVPKLVFFIPTIRWAVQQPYDENGNIISWGVKDSKNNPDPEIGWVDRANELLFIETRFLTGEPNRFKLIVNDGAYRVVDGSGVERPGIIPIRTSITNNLDGTVTIRVLGGDSFRTLLLEESTNFTTWTEVYRVERIPDYYGEQAFEITLPSSQRSFFRVKGL